MMCKRLLDNATPVLDLSLSPSSATLRQRMASTLSFLSATLVIRRSWGLLCFAVAAVPLSCYVWYCRVNCSLKRLSRMKLPFKLVSSRDLRLHHTVVAPEHHHDPKHKEHLFHEHAEVTAGELFYDLIFVAIGIELGHFLKADLTGERLLETLLVFATAWLTWFHTNLMLTRFTINRPWSILVFFIMLGTLGSAIHAVDETASSLQSGFGENDALIFGSLLMTRLSFLIVYSAICVRIPLTRPMISKYIVFFSISSMFLLAATAADNTRVSRIMWLLTLVLELSMYPLSLVSTPHEFQLTVNTAHLLERNQLWVILILGESIISIASAQHTRDADYYVTVICAFLIVYWLMRFHILSQHLFDERAEEHALDHSPLMAFVFDTLQLFITSGMLLMAVGIKLAIQYSGDQALGYKQSFAWLLTGSLGVTLITMNLSRVCHKLRPLIVCGKPTGRYAVIGAEIVLSALVIPLAIFIQDSEKTKLVTTTTPGPVSEPVTGAPSPVGEDREDYGPYESDSDFKAMHLLIVLTVVVGILLLLESMVKAIDDEVDEVDEELFFSKGTQTTLTSFAAQVEDSRSNPVWRQQALLGVRRHRPNASPHPHHWYDLFHLGGRHHDDNQQHHSQHHHRFRFFSRSRHSLNSEEGEREHQVVQNLGGSNPDTLHATSGTLFTSDEEALRPSTSMPSFSLRKRIFGFGSNTSLDEAAGPASGRRGRRKKRSSSDSGSMTDPAPHDPKSSRRTPTLQSVVEGNGEIGSSSPLITRTQSIDALSEASNESDAGMGLQLVVNDSPGKSRQRSTAKATATSPLNPRRTVSLGTYDLQKSGDAASAALRRVRHQHQRHGPMLASTEEEGLAASYDSTNSLRRNDESILSLQSSGHRRPKSRKHTHLEDEFSRDVEQETFYVVPSPDDDDSDVFEDNNRMAAQPDISDVRIKLNQSDLDSSLGSTRINGGVESVV
eukprot:m.230725 g.230725  ORF g.230725 m.230725 type:complete len:955 (-) comp17355_c0_seq1:2691-5555(-)